MERETMNLMRYKYWYFVISAFVIIPGLISLFLFGLKPAIDFTGGSLLHLQIEANQDQDPKALLSDLTEEYQIEDIQYTAPDLSIRAKEMTNEQKDMLLAELAQRFPHLVLRSFETLGPSIGAELLQKTLTALILVAVLITLYVWKQFSELKYGVSAVLAMFHDSLVLLGVFSLLGHFRGIEVDTLFVTAMLTTLSFSVHDTIVVYDRIRELRHKYPRIDLDSLANVAVVETLGRSLNNSLTIILMLLVLVLLGGQSIHYFALALLVGSITGTYSSSFTAVPLLLCWPEKKKSV
jgi:preprotein translocase subunit SecF